MGVNNLLQEILKIEAQISDLAVYKNKLQLQYLKENFPFKKGDKIIVTYKDSISGKTSQLYGEINLILFDSHSKIKGLAKVQVYSMSKKGIRHGNRYPFFLNSDYVIDIKYFNK